MNYAQYRLICQGVSAWNRYRSMYQDENIDLSGAILSKLDLSSDYGANLSDADLTLADLSRANLSGVNLSNATLVGADMTEVVLRDTALVGAERYTDVRIRYVNFASYVAGFWAFSFTGSDDENYLEYGCEDGMRTIRDWREQLPALCTIHVPRRREKYVRILSSLLDLVESIE